VGVSGGGAVGSEACCERRRGRPKGGSFLERSGMTDLFRGGEVDIFFVEAEVASRVG